ncbi:hypothetical protein B0F88_109107 [Methylobacter tundripaludum]|uniref:Uncharacterized protein n=1 Tax=Methylobacter tundripaludum TaxID=173365 RepID=A0A2S6GXU7_9GAMM|nr:hypothetical protein B0F88_109107 [Methylobacter tundripaludum]
MPAQLPPIVDIARSYKMATTLLLGDSGIKNERRGSKTEPGNSTSHL